MDFEFFQTIAYLEAQILDRANNMSPGRVEGDELCRKIPHSKLLAMKHNVCHNCELLMTSIKD